MKALPVLLFIVALNSTGAYASREACAEEKSTLGMYDCWKAKKAEADGVLNKQYTDLKLRIQKNYHADTGLGEAYFAMVKKSQLAWLSYRDQNCSMKSFEIEVGSQAYETEQNRCIAEMSRSRAEELALIAQ